ncbi:MAG TPA: 16S rRNA (cytidine(1402)-2'-O)-methyltransferase [Gemmatimonadaceae bacterium]|nr:16S rRNA (cytidine(1402)-2'-O)-methyltransferase [Gemmatimonadaceae bacterium]
MVAPDTGRLFVVSTPIGNLGDITHRAVEILRTANLVLAEDTRHSRRLLDHIGSTVHVQAYHEHNEARTAPALIERLLAGAQVALISDAGTPLLSDPGARLVQQAIDAGVSVVPIPGASALLAALVGSGISAERFTYFGFLERKGAERRRALEAIAALEHTAILFEAPGRVGRTLTDLDAAGCGERSATVARELTKQFEEFRRGTVRALAAYYTESAPRGEVVIVLAGRSTTAASEDVLRAEAGAMRERGVAAREIVDRLVTEFGASRNVAYRLAHDT